MTNYATKKELGQATCADTSDLAASKDFVALKADINKFVNVPTSLNNLKTTVDNLDVDKTVCVHLKKFMNKE